MPVAPNRMTFMWASRLDRDAAPKREVAADVIRRLLGVGVIPGAARAHLAVHHHVLVAGGALPGADRVPVAVLEVLPAQSLRWKVVVAFHHYGLVALRHHFAVPDRLHGAR